MRSSSFIVRHRNGPGRATAYDGSPAGPITSPSVKIVVAALKGGVGKTTTCVYLAALASAAGREVVLVDADAQASAADWLETSADPALEAVELVEAPTERMLAKAMNAADDDHVVIVDSPPGNERIIGHALEHAHVVVIPTRVGGVEWPRVDVVRKMVPRRVPSGLVICSARTFTRDYTETLQYWVDQGVEVWGTIPERVAIASGPDQRLSPDGVEAYRPLWRRITRKALA